MYLSEDKKQTRDIYLSISKLNAKYAKRSDLTAVVTMNETIARLVQSV